MLQRCSCSLVLLLCWSVSWHWYLILLWRKIPGWGQNETPEPHTEKNLKLLRLSNSSGTAGWHYSADITALFFPTGNLEVDADIEWKDFSQNMKDA